MDLWVVGAAAAVGYIAKYWQNIQKDWDTLSESGPSDREKHEVRSRPILPRLSGRKKHTEDTPTSMVERISSGYKLDHASEAGICTSFLVENPGSSGHCNYSDIPSLSRLPLGFSTNDILEEHEDEIGLTSTGGDVSHWVCAGKVDFFRDSKKKGRTLRTKYCHSIKPLSSLESCLMAQLYQEHSKMEDYMLSFFPSTSTMTRTLLVTDGNQIISRANRSSFRIQVNDDDRLLKDGHVRGVLPLPKVTTLDALNGIQSKIQKGQNERLRSSSKVGSGRRFLSQHGSLDQTFLFCLGISVGIIASLLSSGKEINKVKDLLKQTENLVQDLQEELEMKDSITVKELTDENTRAKMDSLVNYNSKESQYEKAEETSGDMSKIEAELEAELERLGLSINASSQERKLSDIIEHDPEFTVDFAQGELRADVVNGLVGAQAESDRDASCTLRTPTGNYAVSPRELSLRLHEVIELRLEERVKKLEQALQNSERKIQLMEFQCKSVKKNLSGRKLRYSSGEESPVSEEDFNPMAEPFVMNLSGEGLDAYNQAYKELMKTNDSEEDNSPPRVYRSNLQASMQAFHQSLLQDQNGNVLANGSLTRVSEARERTITELSAQTLVDNGQGVQELVYDGTSEDDKSEYNDEMEKQLIKQIVEKMRKGSPVVLNAQRMLFSRGEMDEHKFL